MPAELNADEITPADSPLKMSDVVSSPMYADLFTPTVEVGGPAFDFTLPHLDRNGGTVRLSDFAGNQPVALIFGSYT